MPAFAETGFTVSPQANTASPAALMLHAAFTSRLWMVLHSGHAHCRVAKSSLSRVYPQLEQRLLEGNQRSIATTVRPYQPDLYSSCLTNSPQFASLMDLASVGFLTMFLTARFSTQITWFSLIRVVVNLWVKSFRQFAIFSWMRATFFLAFSRFFDSFCFLYQILLKYFSIYYWVTYRFSAGHRK